MTEEKSLKTMFEGIHIVSSFDVCRDGIDISGYYPIAVGAYYSSKKLEGWRLDLFEKQMLLGYSKELAGFIEETYKKFAPLLI